MLEKAKKELEALGLKNYGKALCVFVVFAIFSLAVFFFAVGRMVEKNTNKTLTDNISRQAFHFYNMFDMQYDYLEGMAGGLARSENLFSDTNFMLLHELCSHSSLQRAALIDPDGNIYYDNGEKNNVAERDYFQTAISGRRALSLPLTSILDHVTRVILAVPVYQDEDTASGVLAVSCDIRALNHMLFKDIYDDTGCSMLVAQDGTVITYDNTAKNHYISAEDNFFTYYGKKKFLKGGSIDRVKADFQEEKTGSAKMCEKSDSSNPYYLIYTPLQINHWMVCYLVPVSEVEKDYAFISQYELLLSGVLVIALFLLLLTILRMNHRKHEALLHFAQTDALTSINNRQSTEGSINHYLKESGDSLCAFMMMDVDKFKDINDTYGHASGDIVLQKIGNLLKAGFRESDIVGRIGGDEFVVFMKHVDSKEIVLERIENLQRSISSQNLEAINGHKITTSLGLAFAPEHGTTYLELYKASDEALYETKRHGRNGYTIFTPRGEEAIFHAAEKS